MSSSCIEEVSVPDDNWYRIANELLSRAGIAINGSAPADIRVKNPDFFKRVLQEGSLGLGESYMDGWWECDRLDMFFSKVLRAGLENQLPHHFKDTLRIAGARLFNLQSKKRAWIVGKEHYDLGNDLFSRMLDPFMQYSCAYWKDADNLESAQQAKLKMICEKLQLKPGMRVLDIGCGWGGLAHYMASNYDVSVVGVTISAEQQKMAQERCEGLDVTILLQDYRDLNDQFDRIVSVGMFEHVGPKNYDTYFAVVDRNLTIGTTGRGIGPAYEDKVARRGLRVGDLFDKETFAEKLKEVMEYHNFQLVNYYKAEAVDYQKVLDDTMAVADILTSMVVDVSDLLDQARQRGDFVMFEGAQGTLLDIDHGTYPYVTSSNTTAGGVATGSGLARVMLITFWVSSKLTPLV